MRMIMADDRRPAISRRAMGGDQRRRIDFETVGRIGGDVGARQYAFDILPLPQQKPANLGFWAGDGRRQHFVEQTP